MMKHILFRFDASSEMGIGHAFRCMALIEYFSLIDNIYCIVIAKSLPNFIVYKLEPLKAKVFFIDKNDASSTEIIEIKTLALRFKAKGIIVDGYQFSSQYRQSLSTLNLKVITFDDTNDLEYLFCDLLINALPFANTIGYEKSAHQAKKLLGLKFSIIRQDFLNQKTVHFNKRSKLLINFGGSDIANLTLPLIKKLLETKIIEQVEDIIVITGGAYCQSEKVTALSVVEGFKHIHNCQNMAEILIQCKVAICAPGALVYELAFCGVPSVFLTIANNQLLSAQAHQKIGWCKVENGLDKKGIDLSLLHLSELWTDDNKLQNMSNVAQKLIDGKGVARICTAIKEVST